MAGLGSGMLGGGGTYARSAPIRTVRRRPGGRQHRPVPAGFRRNPAGRAVRLGRLDGGRSRNGPDHRSDAGGKSGLRRGMRGLLGERTARGERGALPRTGARRDAGGRVARGHRRSPGTQRALPPAARRPGCPRRTTRRPPDRRSAVGAGQPVPWRRLFRSAGGRTAGRAVRAAGGTAARLRQNGPYSDVPPIHPRRA